MTIPVLAAGGGSSFLLVIVVLFAVMYVFMIRPQKKKQLAQKQLLQNVEIGAEIITAGGLIGTVMATSVDELTLEIAPGTNVRVARRAVAAVVPKDEVVEEAYDEGDEIDEEPAVETTEPRRG